MNLINRSTTKRFILMKFKQSRPGMDITRVSGEALDKYEAKLRAWIADDVRRHPTRGKTFTEVWMT